MSVLQDSSDLGHVALVRSWRTRRTARSLVLAVSAVLLLVLVTAAIITPRLLQQPQTISTAATEHILNEASSYMQRGDLDRAAAILRSVLKEHPEHPTALLYHGMIASQRGNVRAAVDACRRIGDSPPETAARARFLEAMLLMQQGKARQAEPKMRRAVELDPQYAIARQRLVQLYVLQMRRLETLEQLNQIQRYRRLTREELVLQLAAGRRIAKPAEGIKEMEIFLAADPLDTHSGLALARYYREEARDTEAIKLLQRLLERVPQATHVRGTLAAWLLERSEFDQARRLLAEHPPRSGDSLWLWRAAAFLDLNDGAQTDAARRLMHVVRHDPDDGEARYRLALLLDRMGLTDIGREQLEQSVHIDRLQRQAIYTSELNPNARDVFLPAVLLAAELLEKVHRPDVARHWYELALAVDPRSQRAIAGRQSALLSLSRGDSQRSAERFPSLPQLDATAVAVPIRHAVLPTTLPPAIDRPRDIRFEDQHEQAGIDFQYFNGQTGSKYLVETTGGGVAVLDYDNDGWPDLYFTQGCSIPVNLEDKRYQDRLFRNLGNGRFVDVTARAGIEECGYSQGCAAGDLDNDGYCDMVISNYGRSTIYHNNGDGTFTDITVAAGITAEEMSMSLGLGDLDRDGDLDLYVTNYVDSLKVCTDRTGRIGTCDPGESDSQQHRLYCNRGDGTYEDITQTSGILASNGRGLGVVVADFNDDRWPDIYVANDGTPNFLFINHSQHNSQQLDSAADSGSRAGAASSDTGTGQSHIPASGIVFQEQGLVLGAALSGEGKAQAGMGIACGDLNGDQHLDLFVTNFYREPNTLYLNQSSAMFMDVIRSSGIEAATEQTLGWGTQAADFDLDGHLDLFVANGHVDDLQHLGAPWKMPAQLFAGTGGGRFQELTGSAGDYFHRKVLGRGAARLDWNRDGRPDMVVVHQDAPAALLTNTTPEVGHFVSLTLHGTRSNRQALGARLILTAGDRSQLVEITGGDGFLVTNDRTQVVGLGTAERLSRLDVLWPSGQQDSFSDLPVDCHFTLVEGRQPLVHTR